MPLTDSGTQTGLPSIRTTTTNNHKITCETLADDDDDDDSIIVNSPEHHPDSPPDSFWLSKDAELDWFDRNAFFNRKDSTRANNSNAVSNSNPSSQRLSVPRKSILGLPKPQRASFIDGKHRRNQTSNRLFPKRAELTSKTDAPEAAEPSSPKVSCMGRVRSKRDRSRRLKNRQRSVKLDSMPDHLRRNKKKCLWKNIRSIFKSGAPKSTPATEPKTDRAERRGRSGRSRRHMLSREGSAREPAGTVESVNGNGNVPGLGGMTRFSSGRRSDAWVGEVAERRSGPLDVRGAPSLRKRRGEAGAHKGVNCSRDGGPVGPASD